jgi:hypothetical protein
MSENHLRLSLRGFYRSKRVRGLGEEFKGAIMLLVLQNYFELMM